MKENFRIYDVQFDELTKDPIAQIVDIYSYFNISLDHSVKDEMRSFARHNKRGSKGQHKHNESTFGWESKELEMQFQSYSDFFNISVL